MRSAADSRRQFPFDHRRPARRLAKLSRTGQLIDKAEKGVCRAFSDPQRDELARGPKRNFQVLDPLDLLAAFTQHIPPKGVHLNIPAATLDTGPVADQLPGREFHPLVIKPFPVRTSIPWFVWDPLADK